MKKSVFVLTGLSGVFLVGCIFLSPFSLPAFAVKSKFNHKAHIKKEEMTCEDCHGEVAKLGKATMPAFSDCEDCHDEDNRTEKYVAFLKGREVGGKIQWISLPDTYGDVKFSHQPHLAKYNLKCEDCHGDIANSEVIRYNNVSSMENCQECHLKKAKGPVENCEVCHTTIRKETKPKSHNRMWISLHGDRSYDNQKKCLYCHSERTCVSCHQTQPPKSHGAQWLHGSHGYAAEMDRKQCEVCHTADSCVRCHNSTSPINHTGGWGGSQNLHCLGCHEPSTPNCSVCHPNTAGHQTWATKKPNNTTHNNATSCRTCHGDLKHPDNGQSCRTCH